MYLQYFGLTEPPFSITPDPAFVYLSPAHRDALAHLLYGVGKGGAGGFVQLTGEVGTGKTTICRCLLEQVPEDAQIALVLNPMVTPIELLATICEELGIETGDALGSSKALVDRLNDYSLEQHAQGRRVVVVIDEAQNLSPDALEQVRLLTNLETPKHKLLQMVLLGQPELRQLLERQELRQLAQRITARYHLAPLAEKETFAYVRHRMTVAGARQNPFSRRALRGLYQRSRGIPRLINIIADRALAGAYAREQTKINARLVHRAADEVQPSEERVRGHSTGWALAASALVVLLAVGVYAWRPDLFRRLDGPDSPPAAPAGTRPAAAVTERSDAARLASESGMAPVTGVSGAQPSQESSTEAVAAPQDAGTATDPAVGGVATVEATTRDEPQAPPAALGVPTSAWLEQQDAQAWTALAELWRDPSSGAAVNSACRGQFGTGYGCVQDQGSWSRILQLGLPAILVLHDGGRRHVLLRGLDEDSIRLGATGSETVFSRQSIERIWFGEYYVAWQQAPDWPMEIRRGESGEAVEIVMRMAALAQPPWQGDQHFDAAFESWVMEFQSRHGLDTDGIIGPKTLLYLMAPAITEPRLKPATEGTI